MEPLICPQCGGQITSYSPGQTFATCGYCSTKFLIESQKETPTAQGEPIDESLGSQGANPKLISAIVTILIVAVGLTFFFALGVNKNRSTPNRPVYGAPKSSSPATNPIPNLLEFGGKGSEHGLFRDANSIAVDKYGRIYVSDDTLRVQSFDTGGNFLSAVQIPANGANYEHARGIDKIAVSDEGSLYVAVGGVVLIYGENPTKPSQTIQVAPNYIRDFALRNDGGMLMISTDDNIETLIFVSRAGKITRRIRGFHTDAADAAISPQEIAVAAIRLAVDSTGDIYSVYALGDLSSYSLSYNSEDLMILHFTPEGKFVNKFVQSMNSCGIAVDNQNRIYISNGSGMEIYTKKGDAVSGFWVMFGPRAFALDKQNNVYALVDDKVIKRAAVQ